MVTKDKLTLKLIDFASCYDLSGTPFDKMLEEEEIEKNKNSKRKKPDFKYFVGTPHYMPIESVKNKGVYKETDSWSLGCILFQLYVGFPPFLGGSDYLLYQKSIEAKYNFPEGVIDPIAEDLIKSLLQLDHTKRLNIEAIKNHAYFSEKISKYPVFSLSEIAFLEIVNILISKYEKEGRRLTEDFRKLEEDIRLTNTEEDEEKLKEKKCKEESLNNIKESIDQIRIEFEKEVDKYIDEILSSCHSDYDETKRIVSKFRLLKKQINHDLFNITFSLD